MDCGIRTNRKWNYLTCGPTSCYMCQLITDTLRGRTSLLSGSQLTTDSEAVSTKEASGIPSLSQDARTHYCAHAYAHTYAHAQSQACAFHEHANDSCQQNARSIENICGAASTPIRIQEACGIPLQSGCMHALLYARTCTHICTCARPSLLCLRALFCTIWAIYWCQNKTKN